MKPILIGPTSRIAVAGKMVEPSLLTTFAARYSKRAPANGSSRHGTRVRVLFASALLHPQKFGRALVELVVADRGEAEAQQVHRIDRRLVEEIGRGERRGADEVARGDRDRVGIALTRLPKRGGELRRAADPHLEHRPVRLRDRHRVRRRLDIAVEIVDRENLHLDRRGWRLCDRRPDLRRACRKQQGRERGRQPADHRAGRPGSARGSANTALR